MAKAEYRPGQTPGVLISAAGGRRVTLVHARYGHPLRFYIRPHFGKCGAVVPLKLHLVHPTATRPHGCPKQALCKVAFAGDGRTAVGASRSLARPTRRRQRALVVCMRRGISQALRAVCLVSGLRPFLLCLPPPTRGPRRCAALAPRWTAHSPREGAPSVSAKPGAAALTRRIDAKSTRHNGTKYGKSSYIRPYIAHKEKDLATYSIARSPISMWGG